jgi:hypothetical protein
MVWNRSGEAKDIAIHGCHNKIKIISTVNIFCQDHAISVMKRNPLDFYFLFLKGVGEMEKEERENYGTERLSISYEVSPMSTTSAHEVGPSIRYK